LNNAPALAERKELPMARASGTRLGPYEILEPLGAGGMGEVYRARDPRLGRDVAVKLVTTDGAPSPDRVRRFETEARAAAQLAHPNVITVFDVGTHEGRPYLVLELLEGRTLRETLRAAAPSLREAVSWSLECARGLGAAHDRGIVHRDLKPENVFVTVDGRVKVLDFGLAKLREPIVEDAERESPTETRGTKPGTMLGTVGYMAPEQVRGEVPDARTDVFALGAVLFELVTRRRPFGGSSEGEVLAAILRDEPPAPSSLHPAVPPALDGVVRRCLAKPPAERFSSGREVAAALETVLASLGAGRFATARAPEMRGPYPGLESFRESDTERFFGREAEVEALWARLHERRLLAVIGPSGVGKTSFVRAGVLASRPTGWAALVCAPGANPFRSLGQALAPQLADDPEALSQLLGFDEEETAVGLMARWRRAHTEALLVVDQLEELFTQSPEEEQARFAALLGRVAGEADVHVVLSLRDDFLMRCSEHDALARVFTELTPLRPLSGDGLRRALVEPAKREGFSFEEGLVEEMLQAVEGARGALPLLAFAVSRLWQERDRERKLLTRAAYEEIGGVAGALAQHAEATLERIGEGRQALVREIFRNLVTAQGTRASCEREELLSAFPDRSAAETALEELIEARLLTSYEVEAPLSHPDRGGAGSPASSHSDRGDVRDRAKNLADPQSWGSSVPGPRQYRIEIVHESLLKAWPRLVWWQAQDEEGAQLRDQLRQAARLWEEKGRTEDLLWSGTAEREFEVWRDRYPGQLTAIEDDFARAMVERARRRKRVLRAAIVMSFVALLAVLTIIGGFWRRSVDQARRAEAGKLLALAERQLEKGPTEALAYATASIGLADTNEARIFATRTLWKAPPAFDLSLGTGSGQDMRQAVFSPDGRWVALSSRGGTQIEVWGEDGSPVVLHDSEPSGADTRGTIGWTSSGFLVTGLYQLGPRVDVWSVPEGRRVRTIEFEHPSWCMLGGDHLMVEEALKIHRSQRGVMAGDWMLRSWRLPDGEPVALGQVFIPEEATTTMFAPDVSAWLRIEGQEVFAYPLPIDGRGPRLLDRFDAPASVRSMQGNRLYLGDNSGEIHVWTFPPGAQPFKRVLSKPEGAPAELVPLDAAGRWFATAPRFGLSVQQVGLWDSSATAPSARPLTFSRNASWLAASSPNMTPSGDWMAVPLELGSQLTFWPVPRAWPIVADYPTAVPVLALSPDGCWLAAAWPAAGATVPQGLTVRLSPLPGCAGGESRTLEGVGGRSRWLGFDPRGRYLVAAQDWPGGGIYVVPLDGRPPRQLPGSNIGFHSAAVSPSGRRVATAWGYGEGVWGYGEGEKAVHVWDVETGESRRFALPAAAAPEGEQPTQGVGSLSFIGDSVLLTGDMEGVRRWDLETGHSELIVENEVEGMVGVAASADGQTVIRVEDPFGETGRCFPVQLVRLSDGTTQTLRTFGDCVRAMALDPSGTVVVTGDKEGIVRVGRPGGDEPHLLYGHDGLVWSVTISPDRRWIASAGNGTLRIWPMPDLDRPPIHTLPHDELVAKLESLTNIRVVRDPESPEGWKLELDRFPGWKDVPTWFTPSPEWLARMEAPKPAP
jgi:WD40 repeat protein